MKMLFRKFNINLAGIRCRSGTVNGLGLWSVGTFHAGRVMMAGVQTAYHNTDAIGPLQVAL